MEDPRHLLIKVVEILNKLEIPYIVTGGIAVLIWGRPRFTADIDIVIQFKIDKIDKLEKALRSLGKEGYIDKESIKEALLNKGEFNFVDGNTGVKVDFWVIEEDIQFKRKIIKKVLNKKVNFISPEDLILNKLLWHKESGSERQLEDVESIFKITKKLDLAYLKKQASKHSFLSILNKFLKK